MSEINKYKITWKEFYLLCLELARKINKKYDCIFPIAKNGLYVAERLSSILKIPIEYEINYDKNILVVDDLVDSGRTINQYGDFDTAVLIVKNLNSHSINFFVREMCGWIVFPWEKDNDIEGNIIRILEYIGEDSNREGLKDTPRRMIKSWDKLFEGYRQKPVDVITTFEDDRCDEMIVLKDIEFYSNCEHHFLPFFGVCHISYIPQKKIIGVSKLARIMEIFARRLQIQERLTNQIADCIMDFLSAKGVMVVIEAQHLCTLMRGVQKQKSKMITSAVRGLFKEDIKVKEEFLSLIKG